MEAAGVAISVASLVALAQTAVDCFQYVQVGKAFGTDYQTTCLRLDNAQLRLSRWAEALSQLDDKHLAGSLPSKELDKARTLLGHITNLLDRAESASNKFNTNAKPNNESTEIDFADAFTPEVLPLHQRMRALCLRRQSNTSYIKKAKWALYAKDSLNELVDNVQALVNDLSELFPTLVPLQQQLSDQEAAELVNEAALPILRETAAEQDKMLEEAIVKLNLPKAAPTQTWKNRGNTKVMIQGNQTIHGGQQNTF